MTRLIRDVNGVNIFISCHGAIGPGTIRVTDNTTFHFYTEPGNYFWCPNAYDVQPKSVCKHIHDNNGRKSGINFSISNGVIPNFILRTESNQENFMSRVYVCDENGNLNLLFDMIAYQRQGLLGRVFTLQDILNIIRTRGIGMLRFGANDVFHYHCMFCQDGAVPQFWTNARDAARIADNARLTQQNQMTPPRQIIDPTNIWTTPTGQHGQEQNVTPRRIQERDACRQAWKTGGEQRKLFTTPTNRIIMNVSTTPSPGQGAGQGAGSMNVSTTPSPARRSSLSRTFSSQPPSSQPPSSQRVLRSPPRVPRRSLSRFLFPRKRGQGRGRGVNPAARRKDVIREQTRRSRRRIEDSLRKQRKK